MFQAPDLKIPCHCAKTSLNIDIGLNIYLYAGKSIYGQRII